MLLVALLAAGWLLVRPQPPPRSPEPTGAGGPSDATLAGRWPDARTGRASATLADGQPYTPRLYLDADVSVGTAPAGDDVTRLLVRDGQSVRELARLPAGDSRVVAVAAAGEDIVWMTTARASDRTTDRATTLHAADRRGNGPARQLTGDVGAVVVTGSQYDLVVADRRAHWAATPTADPLTEIRSMPVTGGAVQVRPVDGRYVLSAWPWLASAAAIRAGPVELRNLTTGARVVVPHDETGGLTCSPALCRIQVPGPPGRPPRTDLMLPDGTRRIRIAAGTTTPVLRDVGLTDRFELLAQPVPGSAPLRRKLLLYDARTNRSTVLAERVSGIGGRDGVVWWSTDDGRTLTWSALDLRTLP